MLDKEEGEEQKEGLEGGREMKELYEGNGMKELKGKRRKNKGKRR